MPRKGAIPLIRGMEEDLNFFFQLWFQIATLLHVKLARQRSSPLIMIFSIKLSNINSTPINIARPGKETVPWSWQWRRKTPGERWAGSFPKSLFSMSTSSENFQLLRSHLNRVKENDKEANKRRLEAMKQLNQRWHMFRCYFSLLCGWWNIADLYRSAQTTKSKLLLEGHWAINKTKRATLWKTLA